MLIAAAFVASSCTKPQDPASEGARLMGQLKAASGGAALDVPAGFHEKGDVVLEGVRGTYEGWGDLHALRSAGTHTLGGRTSTSGFDGQKAWSVGPDGAAQTDTSPQGLASARRSTYLTISGFFYPDRFPARFESRGRKEAEGTMYDVVTVTPADSLPTDLWLDVRTHRLQRIDGVEGTTKFAGMVRRFEVVDGIWCPFALSQTEGNRHMTQDVTSVVFEQIPPERFAPPSN
ncbi:MAG TPA: hypothetical protein VMQ61_16140 [Thermoanaerobaculia bacterium]|nr:hypothetical protein [Thermoanaerobaculia bacterium]